ncbi:Not3-domain-containing protein [Hanseniaspora valbyensis NRRL Y-1626]|uniref:General negative regulator of transcription subunit n=1 Tax=Hanseniaspora valbyensis NRRL Y-1626 TaxID=766949 RepID=A0A1B7TC54_9ASCO|nr:Not3-domain-containing protein [Hanseniaspora valbyensis NRRL Y-1626]
MSSSQRKLYQEIDKSLKKVREGIQDFDQIYIIFEQTDPSNQTYREKLEMDINKQIKKLQKHREQIKTWMSKEDVKDREAILWENRRNIEQRMETAKVVEKMVKLKKFSTQALANPDMAIHPKDLKKYKLIEFLQECIDELSKQREMLEGEIEQGNDDMQTEHLLERHIFNIVNLENILKLINTDGLDVETVEEFKDDIQYYVDNNMDDPDFVEYDTIYEDLGCEVFPNENGELDVVVPAKLTLQTQNLPSQQQQILTPITPSVANTSNVLLNTIKKATPTPVSTPKLNNSTPLSLTPQVKATSSTNLSQFVTKREQNTTTSIQSTNLGEQLTKQVEDQIKSDLDTISKLNSSLQFSGLKELFQSRQDLSIPKQMDPKIEDMLKYSLLNSPDSLDSDFKLGKNELARPHPTSIFFPQEPLQFLDNISIMTNQRPALQLILTEEDKLKGYVKLKPLDTDEGLDRWCSSLSHNDDYCSLAACKIVTKFEVQTLFFIFYHYQDSFEQFVSARELNLRGWVFEKNESKWYKQNKEDGESEEKWEYFDFEMDWKIKKIENYQYNPENFENLEFTTSL